MENGLCGVCRHAERVRIELLLAGGAGQHALARKHGLSKYSVHRHWRNHVTAERRAALIMGPVQRQALAAQVAEESQSVLDHHKATRAGLYTGFASALEASDRNSIALIGGKLTEVNNAIGRLTGQLASSPLVQHNTVNVFMHDPGFLQFMQDLAEALGEYPEARRAVARKFEELERQREAATVEPIPQRLKHATHGDAAAG